MKGTGNYFFYEEYSELTKDQVDYILEHRVPCNDICPICEVGNLTEYTEKVTIQSLREVE